MIPFLLFAWFCFGLIAFFVLGISEKLVEKGLSVLAIPLYLVLFGMFLFGVIVTVFMFVEP